MSACSSDSNNAITTSVSDPISESLISSRLLLESAQFKVYAGFNEQNKKLLNSSFTLSNKVETMLTGLNVSKDVYIDAIATLTEPFNLITNEPVTVNSNVSSTVPPFSIGTVRLNNDFLLLSSSSRFLTPKNTIKTKFRTIAELSTAWLRAVEFSDQRCVYVSLQSIDANGIVINISNTLVVPLVSADQCSVQL